MLSLPIFSHLYFFEKTNNGNDIFYVEASRKEIGKLALTPLDLYQTRANAANFSSVKYFVLVCSEGSSISPPINSYDGLVDQGIISKEISATDIDTYEPWPCGLVK